MNPQENHSSDQPLSAEQCAVDRRDACQALALLVAGGVDGGRWHIADRLLSLLRPDVPCPDEDWVGSVAGLVPGHEADLVDSLFDLHRRGVLDDVAFAGVVASLIVASDP